MNLLPNTPADLAAAGYRIEFGNSELGVRGRQSYWWTWSEGSGIETPVGDWPTADEAVTDARANLIATRWDDAMAYFGLDQCCVYSEADRLRYVQDMLTSERRIERAFELLREVCAVIDMTDPDPTYRDSGADAIEALCELQLDEVLKEQP